MENKGIEEIQIFSSSDELIILQVCAILEENKIPYIKKIGSAGGYMNISAGQTIETKKIFVSEEDYDKAMEIIEELNASTSDELPEELIQYDEEETNEYIEEQKKNMNRVAFYFWVFVVVVVVMIFLLS